MTFSFPAESIRLFRHAVRTINLLPPQTSKKLRYNVREIFEIYRDVQDQTKQRQVISEGWHDLGVLKELMKVDQKILDELFKNFEPIPENIIKTAVWSQSEPSEAEASYENRLPHADLEEEAQAIAK